MTSFFRKCSMGKACKDWSKDVQFFRETPPKEGSAAASNPSPKSPLDVDFDKEIGVTTGLGLIPYLADLWLQNPFKQRIVFGTFNMGVENFSRSLIKVSVANTYELITFNLNPSPRLFSYPSPPSSCFSPLSHTPLIGSLPEIWRLPDDPRDLPIDPDYYLFLRDQCHEEDDLYSFGSEDEDLVLSKSNSDHEHMYVGSFEGMKAQKINHLAHEEENNTKVIIALGTNPKPTDHTFCDGNCKFMEQPRSFVGGLSATFGVRATRPVLPTHETMMHCDFCKRPLNMEQNDSFINCSKQCNTLEVDNEEDCK